jgi:acyl-coenzyme A synthetase/AMP-(fatty) acid ligase
VGYLDAQGRLWMCGRKSQRVVTSERTLFTVPVEEIFNQHPAIKRSALVGVGAKGAQQPVVLLEREPGATLSESQLFAELGELAAKHEPTRGLSAFAAYPGAFPVDKRHNAKIEREKLAAWAGERR